VFVACLWVVGTNQTASIGQNVPIQKTFFGEKINPSSSFQGVSSQGCVGFGWWIGWFLAVFFRTFSNGHIHFFKTL